MYDESRVRLASLGTCSIRFESNGPFVCAYNARSLGMYDFHDVIL